MGRIAHEMRLRALWWFVGSACVAIIAFATKTLAGCLIALVAAIAIFVVPIHYLERGRKFAAELAVWRDIPAVLDQKPPRNVHFRAHPALRLILAALVLSIPAGTLAVWYLKSLARLQIPSFLWVAAIAITAIVLVTRLVMSRPSGLQLHLARCGVLTDAEIIETSGRLSQGHTLSAGLLNIFENVLGNAPEWYATIRFTAGGRQYESKKRFRFEPDVGDRVPVIYDPRNPDWNSCPEELSDIDFRSGR